MDLLSVLIVSVLVIGGYALTLAPVVPGTLMVPLAALAIGLMNDFDEFGTGFWVAQALLVATYLIVDNIAQHYGVKRIGGSGRAMWGGVIGVMVGPFLVAPLLGPLALFVGPPLGAVAGVLIGQALHRRREAAATLAARPMSELTDEERRHLASDLHRKKGMLVQWADGESGSRVIAEGQTLGTPPDQLPDAVREAELALEAAHRGNDENAIEAAEQQLISARQSAQPVEAEMSEAGPSNAKLAAGALGAYLAGTGAKLAIYTVQVILLVVAAW